MKELKNYSLLYTKKERFKKMEKGTRKAFLQEFQKLVGLKSGDLIRKWYNSNVANLGTGKWAWCCATTRWVAT